MKLNNQLLIIMMTMLCYAPWIVTEKRPTKSVISLKREIGKGFAEGAHGATKLIQVAALSQEKILLRVQEIYNNDKKSCFVGASAEQFQEYSDEVERMQKRLKEAFEDVEKINKFLSEGCTVFTMTEKKENAEAKKKESSKKQSKSTSQLKREIGEGFAENAHWESKLIQAAALSQEKLLARLRELINNDKNSCFVGASAAKLQQYTEEIEHMQNLLKEAYNDIEAFNEFLTTGCAVRTKVTKQESPQDVTQKDANGSV